ncbi:hypothetical protein CY652_15430 [Burkholderia sp. WAC0059]|uniref:hypothetical protein n=1 Tax=Burkholderia sp. WAC0059 TaxID=2066022 RepID=UPI000C7F4A5A|nr:hypothetical protein [Burkholderia sp. WAC0059]PLZ01505.1 hypothetical protein CY652_15430 [Burkholderia sp. WAC0059]
MVLPDYLTIPARVDSGGLACLLGETGMVLRRGERPVSPLAGWMRDGAIPARARALLESDAHFRDITGLIGVLAEPDAFGEYRAAWVLARASGGLASVVVRDAQGCSAAQLQDDVRFARIQAKRYCARRAAVLLQSPEIGERAPGADLFVRAFGRDGVEPDRLYDAAENDGVGLSYAWLSAGPPA